MLVKIARPASTEPLPPGGIGLIAGSGPSATCVFGSADAIALSFPVCGCVVVGWDKNAVIARASWRVRLIYSSLELFSSMKKCGIFVLGRNALGAQIQVLTYAFDNFALMLRRSVPTFRCPLATIRRRSEGFSGRLSAGIASIWWQL